MQSIGIYALKFDSFKTIWAIFYSHKSQFTNFHPNDNLFKNSPNVDLNGIN
jgi:hypothetical protein